jgi:hypothetical protein
MKGAFGCISSIAWLPPGLLQIAAVADGIEHWLGWVTLPARRRHSPYSPSFPFKEVCDAGDARRAFAARPGRARSMVRSGHYLNDGIRV